MRLRHRRHCLHERRYTTIRTRLRVGTYRIAYTIDDGNLIVLAVEVGHRRDIYRRL